MFDKFNRNVCYLNKEKSLAIIKGEYDYIIVSGISINPDGILLFKNVEHFVKDYIKALYIINNFDEYFKKIEMELTYDR